jgi:cell division septum initiation protein DivIVA
MTTEHLRPAIRRQTAFVRTLLDEVERDVPDAADLTAELADELERLAAQLVQEAHSLRKTAIPPVLRSRVSLIAREEDSGFDIHQRVTLRAGGR